MELVEHRALAPEAAVVDPEVADREGAEAAATKPTPHSIRSLSGRTWARFVPPAEANCSSLCKEQFSTGRSVWAAIFIRRWH